MRNNTHRGSCDAPGTVDSNIGAVITAIKLQSGAGMLRTGVAKKKGNPLLFFCFIHNLISQSDSDDCSLALAYPQKFASHRRPPAVAFLQAPRFGELWFRRVDTDRKEKGVYITPHYTERDAEAVFRGRSNSNCN